MPPSEGERAPDFTALLCDGETFQTANLSTVLDGGCVVVFYGFSFSAIAENWWKRYERAGWNEFEIPVVGVSREGPYAQNAFIRYLDSPFRLFSDGEGAAAEAYDLLTTRSGMGETRTARRAVFVLDEDRRVVHRWLGEDWISPVPRTEIEAAVAELTG
ncbi:peroxiredoxin family protein [Halococcus thailandensis]|uniref:Peroxiredoxin-like protein n=1 Tax=Halococcus thailandensis JCM 13552 TaxID=1227457 RepID=M0N3E3_9EURY|nr:peroxiredoxin family protein [Halococcus thailandensis]EMA52038.1 peroxiredoxin-like protein [Halococcus thailandensis JCM 13552]